MLHFMRECCALSVLTSVVRSAGTFLRRFTPFRNGSECHALFPSRSCRPPWRRTRGSRGYTSRASCVLIVLRLTVSLRTPSTSSKTCRLKNDLLPSKPSWLAVAWRTVSSRSGIAHCVRWVARLYQKPSLCCHRWVMTGQVLSGPPEAFTIQSLSAVQVDCTFSDLCPGSL